MRMTATAHIPKQVLGQKHFSGLKTQLGETGIDFCSWIGPDDRECMFCNVEEVDPRFADRPSTKVVVNPRRPSLKTLEAFFRNEQRRYSPGEHVNVGYGLPTDEEKRRVYRQTWTVETDMDGIWEGQDLVVVAFGPDTAKPVGYFSFKVKVTLDREDHVADLQIEPVLVYVSPRHRGNGYGIDLSIACALICEDLLEATYRAVPSGTTISGLVYADYESAAGEKIGHFIHECISVKVDLIRDFGRRRSVDLIHFELDADS